MNHRPNVWIALAAALLVAGAGRTQAQVVVEPPGGVGGGGAVFIAPPTESAPATATQPAPATESHPSPTSILQQMLNGGTAPGISEPVLIVPPGPEPGANGLLREGQVIDLRTGRLKRDENGRMMVVFDPRESPAYPPMGVIPSRRLAAMEDAADFVPGRTPKDMAFPISAEVTEYRGKNYLYIKLSAIPVPTAPAAIPPASVPATAPLVHAAAPNVPAAAVLNEDSVVSNRIGRLVRDPKTGAKLIAFEADGRRMADPPMGVVPCKFLAVLEDLSEDGNKPVKFKLSGKVTTYRGKNFLYLKYVGVVPDLNEGIGAGNTPGG